MSRGISLVRVAEKRLRKEEPEHENPGQGHRRGDRDSTAGNENPTRTLNNVMHIGVDPRPPAVHFFFEDVFDASGLVGKLYVRLWVEADLILGMIPAGFRGLGREPDGFLALDATVNLIACGVFGGIAKNQDKVGNSLKNPCPNSRTV